ncbi:MAG: cytochrome C554, partial [Candidatus Aminicenantes bacterium]|nr:cytochrome C554 [Candidatus Aminicenantes bacterium]
MRKISCILSLCILITGSYFLFSQEFTYVGAAKCMTCHKAEKLGQQYLIWQGSKHSQAFEELKTESAMETAKKRELDKHPTESPDCLKCHSPLYEKDPERVAEGVTCEVCHGPGSAYKKMSVMKSREESVKNGLIVYESAEAIKTLCLKCHTGEHFEFESAWEKIKH